MGRDFSLLLERNVGSGWKAPLELEPLFPNGRALRVWAGEPNDSDTHSALEIDWWSIRQPATALFAGELTPLDVVPGIPNNATLGTKRYFLQNWRPDDRYLGSINVRDLLLDDWHQSLVTLRGKWPSWIARLSRNGTLTRVELEASLTQTPMGDAERDELMF